MPGRKETMKWPTLLLALLLIGCSSTDQQTREPAKTAEPQRLESLDILLPRPSSEAEVAYLGIEGSADTFRMDQIKARVLVIEVFDMYCRFCQGAAPKVDELYEINLRSGFGDDVKLIGIGRMNTELEVSTFKDKYKVKFPMFADKDLSITRALQAADEGTPHFIVIQLDHPGRRVAVVHTSTGAFEDAQAFHKMILERSGLKKE